MNIPTDKNLTNLKREAWALQKDRGVRHSEALEITARQNGYKDWHAATTVIKDNVDQKKLSQNEKGYVLIDVGHWRLKVKEQLETDPLLNCGGVGLGGWSRRNKWSKQESESKLREYRNDLLTNRSLMSIRHCCEILKYLPKTKHINKKACGSYGLKHICEDVHSPEFNDYVANGAFIVAARISGFKDSGDYNRDFNISKKALNAIENVRLNRTGLHSISIFEIISALSEEHIAIKNDDGSLSLLKILPYEEREKLEHTNFFYWQRCLTYIKARKKTTGPCLEEYIRWKEKFPGWSYGSITPWRNVRTRNRPDPNWQPPFPMNEYFMD